MHSFIALNIGVKAGSVEAKTYYEGKKSYKTIAYYCLLLHLQIICVSDKKQYSCVVLGGVLQVSSFPHKHIRSTNSTQGMGVGKERILVTSI